MSKEELIKKHLGINTPDWIIQNCIKMLDELNTSIPQEKEENFMEACQVASNMLNDLPAPNLIGNLTLQQKSRRNELIRNAKRVLKMAIDGEEVNPN